jgi:ABC-type cobalt transport system substrate-binding protein
VNKPTRFLEGCLQVIGPIAALLFSLAIIGSVTFLFMIAREENQVLGNLSRGAIEVILFAAILAALGVALALFNIGRRHARGRRDPTRDS